MEEWFCAKSDVYGPKCAPTDCYYYNDTYTDLVTTANEVVDSSLLLIKEKEGEMTCKYDKYDPNRGEWFCNSNEKDPDYGPKCIPSDSCYVGDDALTNLITAANEVVDAYTGSGITPKHIINLVKVLGVYDRE